MVADPAGWREGSLPKPLDGRKCAAKRMSSGPGTGRWPEAFLTQMYYFCVLAACGSGTGSLHCFLNAGEGVWKVPGGVGGVASSSG